MFLVTSGNLLGHIVSQEGIAMDPDKVQAIINTPVRSTAKALSRFFGQIRWHSRMLRHLADFTTLLHAAVHRLPFQWSSIEDEAYKSLRLMLSHAPVVQPPVWSEPFHVFVDASDNSHRQCIHAMHATKLVSASILRQPTSLGRGEELLNNPT